jgi:acetolactate synthase-1/2/3 large subunit
MAGGRNTFINWVQEPRDQCGILRQYTKLDHRLEHTDNPGLAISRLLQVAMSVPQGPVYLSIPRESAMLPLPGSIRFPTLGQMGTTSPTSPDPQDARSVARWLVKSHNPVLFTARIGQDPRAVPEFVRLAELLTIPLIESLLNRCFQNLNPPDSYLGSAGMLFISSPVSTLSSEQALTRTS